MYKRQQHCCPQWQFHIAASGERRILSETLGDLAGRGSTDGLDEECLELSAVVEAVAERLKMPVMRVLEVASFYSMFNLKPVGKWYLQVCGTTPCMLRGSDDISRCIKDKLKIASGETSACGKFSLLEVECLGACVNAPILQVNDDFYEDMDYQATARLLDELAVDNKPEFGSVIGRQGSESEDGATTLKAAKKTANRSK